jgi:formylglycine-generating enzyme required for sulfatase activity
LLDLWARSLPVVIIQWLPEPHWERTAIGEGRRRAVLFSPERPEALRASAPSRVRPARKAIGLAGRHAIPVTTLDSDPLERWARMLAQGGIPVPGVVLPLPPGSPVPTRPEMTVEQQVGRFDSTASPEARRLLRMLIAIPLKFPIIRLVHSSLLPGTGPSVVAEVMLSGLIEQVDPGDPEEARFAFRAGVADVLPEGASARDLYAALRTVARHLGVRFGGKSFEAALRTPDDLLRQGARVPLDELAGEFARAAAPILRILGGRYRRLAEVLEQQGATFELEPVPGPAQGRSVDVQAGAVLEGHGSLSASGTTDPPGTITNSIGMKLVPIPAGEFLMGSPDSDPDAYDDEKPQHRVRITRPFFLGACPVTQAEYEQVMGANPSLFKEQPANPVEQVSWYDAVRFCNRLSERESLRPFYTIEGERVTVPDWGGAGYRLPTEAEWEYACRAGTTTRYWFGDDPATLGDYAWYSGNSANTTHPVRQKHPNPWGLHDMHGNVWEWCWDVYDAEYYPWLSGEPPADDPSGPPDVLDREARSEKRSRKSKAAAKPDELQASATRVGRGGGWIIDARYCRPALRSRSTPEYRYYYLGFRVAAVQSSR